MTRTPRLSPHPLLLKSGGVHSVSSFSTTAAVLRATMGIAKSKTVPNVAKKRSRSAFVQPVSAEGMLWIKPAEA